MDKNKIAIYIRVSTQMQIDKDSLPMQRKDLIAYSRLILNTDDYEIFEDAGYSGKNTDRPEFQRMMQALRTGAFTHLLVWKIDRISRNLLDFSSMYSELKDLNVTFISKSEQFDTSTAIGEAMLKIILVFAELERNMTSERVSATMISRANNGQWNGGRVPFGYDYDPISHVFSINESEAEIVKFIHDSYETHQSLVRIVRELNSSGYRTRLGFTWAHPSVNIILRNVFYCGDYLYNVSKEGDRAKPKSKSEWITVADHHPAIVSREQKSKIISMLDKNQRSASHSYHTKHTHVFGGILYCGKCGSVLHAAHVTKKDGWDRSYYRCENRKNGICDMPYVSDPIIGEFIFNLILNMLNAQSSFTPDTSIDQLQNQILLGDAFVSVSSINREDLEYLRSMLLSGGLQGNVYGVTDPVKTLSKSDLNKLKSRRTKVIRALDRLRNLFLYDDNVMSEKDFILQRENLEKELDEIEQQISICESDNSPDEEDFIRKTSEFIIAKNLKDRNYIYYKRLAKSVDPCVLHDFVHLVLSKIVMDGEYFASVTFKNGIQLHFNKKEP